MRRRAEGSEGVLAARLVDNLHLDLRPRPHRPLRTIASSCASVGWSRSSSTGLISTFSRQPARAFIQKIAVATFLPCVTIWNSDCASTTVAQLNDVVGEQGHPTPTAVLAGVTGTRKHGSGP